MNETLRQITTILGVILKVLPNVMPSSILVNSAHGNTLLATMVTASNVRGGALGSLAGWSVGRLEVLYKWLQARIECLKEK